MNLTVLSCLWSDLRSSGDQTFKSYPLVGRAALVAEIEQNIRVAVCQGEASRTALTGLSGIGKTALARCVCEALRNVLPFQVLLQGVSVTSMRLELARLGHALTAGAAGEAMDENTAVGAFHKYLESTSGWLLLVDDAAELEGITSLLPNKHGDPVGHIIFTSQAPTSCWPSSFRLTAQHALDPLCTEDSMKILGNHNPGRTRGDTVYAEVLCDTVANVRDFVERRLGNHPLAVNMLKGALQGQSVEQARNVMSNLRRRLVDDLSGLINPSGCYLRSLPELIQEMLTRLEERCGQHGDRLLYLKVLELAAMTSYLDPSGVPKELFCFSDPVVTSKQLFASAEFESAAKLLEAVGFLEVCWVCDSMQVRMHTLTQVCLRERLALECSSILHTSVTSL